MSSDPAAGREGIAAHAGSVPVGCAAAAVLVASEGNSRRTSGRLSTLCLGLVSESVYVEVDSSLTAITCTDMSRCITHTFLARHVARRQAPAGARNAQQVAALWSSAADLLVSLV